MYVQQSGGPNSSNRSVSLSMDDSATLHLHQVNQKMKIVNEQQLHVRKPSEKEIQKCDHCSALQDKSPAHTSLTPQLPSDRVNGFQGTEIKDLLLINEEPSVKEQSLQIGNVVPNKILSMEDLEQGQEQSALKQNIVIDEKLRNSFSEVRWSKMVSSKSNPTNTQYKLHQFSIISDKGAQFIINHLNKFTQFLQKLTNPQKHNNLIQLLYRFLVGVFQIYYFSVILLELQQQQVNIIKNPLCQFLIFFTQIYEIFLKFTSIQYQNGIEINKLTQNFKIYVQFRIYIDIITIIPFIFYLSNADYSWIYILYLIRLIDIKESLIMLSQLINSINFAFFAQIIIELHFLINLCGAVINQLTSQNRSIQQIGILYIFQNNQQAEIGIQYLVYVIQLLLICYFLFLVKQILKYDQKDQINLKQLTIDQNQKLQLVQQLQSLEEKSDQISVNQYLDILPTKEQENIKFPQYSKYLKSLQIFKNSFSEPTFQKLTTLMQEFTLPPNSHIISPHSRNQSLFFIISGNIQIYQNNSEAMFRLHIIGENQTFNNQAFFMNQLPNIGAKTIGYCRILQLDYDLFQDLLQKIHFEKQKYKMIVDQVCLYQHYYLAGIKCYACHQHHDINNCSNVHYIPNPTMLIQYIHENEQMHRINYIRKKTRSDRLNKANIFKIEDAALLFQQFNVESELSNYERQIYRSEYQPSINKQLTTPFSSPNHDNDDKQVSNQAIPAVVEEDRSMPQQQALELNNISPVPHIQQPPSGFSHSSYQYLLKDVSITYNNKKPKLEGSDKEKNSSNMFSIPYSSSGTSKNNLKNSKNSEILAQYKQQEQQEKEEQLSIQLKKAKAQDSLFYNQKRLFKHRNSGSQNDNQSNSSSKYKKYYTGIQQSQKSERSERKSNSMINDYISERGLLQQYLDQKNNEDNRQQSRNGIQSSKFTGETAKQFMHNPLEMPNIDFYQSFEKSNQFSDYFPGQNIDQAIESYKQYQASRSSLYNQQK